MTKIAELELPDGRIAEFEVPDNYTPQQAVAAGQEFLAQSRARAERQVEGDPITQGARAGVAGFPSAESHQSAQDITGRIQRDITPMPGEWGSGVARKSYELGGDVTDFASGLGLSPENSARIGNTANIGLQALPALIAGKMQGVGVPPQPSLGGFFGRKLMQSATKPLGSHRRVPGKVDRAMTTMLEEGIYPTTSGMDKASRISGRLERNVIEPAVSASTGRVPISDVLARTRPVLRSAVRQVNPQADINAVRGAVDEFRTSPLVFGSNEISVPLAHALKQGTYRSLGERPYSMAPQAGEQAGISTQKAIARGLREEVGARIPEQANSALERQASIMNARSVGANRAGASANRDPMGLGALRLTDAPGSTAAFLMNRWDALKALLAEATYKVGQPRVIAPAAIVNEERKQQQR